MTEHLGTLIKMAARIRQQPGDIRPGVENMGFSQFLPEEARANPMYGMAADVAPYFLFPMVPGVKQLQNLPQSLVNAAYRRRYNIPSQYKGNVQDWAKHLKDSVHSNVMRSSGRSIASKTMKKGLKNATGRASTLGYGVVLQPLVETSEYLLNKGRVAREALRQGASIGSAQPFTRYNSQYTGSLRKASLEVDMPEERFDDIRAKALMGISALNKIAAGSQEEEVKTAAALPPPRGMTPLRWIGVLALASFLTQQVGRAYLQGESTVAERLTRKKHWRDLVARYPEFDKNPKYKILFEDIHRLSPRMASIPSTTATLLRNSVDYGADGVDLNTARALIESQTKSPGYVATSMRMEPVTLSPVMAGMARQEQFMSQPPRERAFAGTRDLE